MSIARTPGSRLHALRRMPWCAALLTACTCACASSPTESADADHPSLDGGARADASAAPLDAGRDPSCHWDCFGQHSCRDGVVHTLYHAPVPCDEWRGACPEYVSYTCERGCRTDGVTSISYREEPVTMCEEGRPKVAGDPCTDDRDCEPPNADGAYETVDRHYLACDTSAMTCVPIPDPTPADWLAPCGGDLSRYTDASGSAYGVLRDGTCSGGLCDFGRRPCPGCTLTCEHDWQCPDGAGCFERRDWTDGVPSAPGPDVRVWACEPYSLDSCP